MADKTMNLGNDSTIVDLNISGKYTGQGAVHYIAGSGSTAAVTTSGSYTAARWKGTYDGITALYDGLTIAYKTDVAGHSSYGTVLNINDLGNHPVVYNVNTAIGTRYSVGSIIVMVYDSAQTANAYVSNVNTPHTGCWKICDYDTTNLYQLRNNYNGNVAKETLYRYQLLLSSIDGTSLIPTSSGNNTTGTSKTMTSQAFDPFGKIFYYNTTTTVNANSQISGGTLYERILLDLRYSTNCGSTLTVNKAVYLVAVPQSDGTAKLASTAISTSLPTSDDGKIYIYLGQAYSTYQIELSVTHPVYWYKNGRVVDYSKYTYDVQTQMDEMITIEDETDIVIPDMDDIANLQSQITALKNRLDSIVNGDEISY